MGAEELVMMIAEARQASSNQEVNFVFLFHVLGAYYGLGIWHWDCRTKYATTVERPAGDKVGGNHIETGFAMRSIV